MPIRSRDLKAEARKAATGNRIRRIPVQDGENIATRLIAEARPVMGDLAMFDALSADKVKIFVDRSQQLLALFNNPVSQQEIERKRWQTYKRRGSFPEAVDAYIEKYDPNESSKPFNPLPPFGEIHVFHNSADAMATMTPAMAGLIVSNLLSRCTARIHPGGKNIESREYKTALMTARKSVAQIVAATPWMIGWRPPKEQPSPGTGDGDDKDRSRRIRSISPDVEFGWEEDCEEGATLVLFMMWPMFAAATSEFSLQGQKEYMLNVLRFLSHDRGIKQAGALVRIAEGNVDDGHLTKLAANAGQAMSDITGLLASMMGGQTGMAGRGGALGMSEMFGMSSSQGITGTSEMDGVTSIAGAQGVSGISGMVGMNGEKGMMSEHS